MAERACDWVSVAWVARKMACSEAWVYRAIRSGLLPACRLPSGRIRIERADAMRLLDGPPAEKAAGWATEGS